MISEEALKAARRAYDIEAECISKMKEYMDDVSFSKAVELLAAAPRIRGVFPFDKLLDFGNGLRRELVDLAFADRFFDMFNGVQPVLVFRGLLSADMNY